MQQFSEKIFEKIYHISVKSLSAHTPKSLLPCILTLHNTAAMPTYLHVGILGVSLLNHDDYCSN